ncbi:unnamed protein product [Rotaria socialis]
MDPSSQESNRNPFVTYYQASLCKLQSTNNDLLKEILQKNHLCTFFMDRSMSCLLTHSTAAGEDQYEWTDEFRKKFPLTTYEDYRAYMDRMVNEGEKNLLSGENVVYFSLSSGTTDKMKTFPLTSTTMRKVSESMQLGHHIVRRSFPPTSFSPPKQRSFVLLSSKKSDSFERSKHGIPIGPISQFMSAVPSFSQNYPLVLTDNTLGLDTIEEIPDFETSVFIQLVFALANRNIYSYSVTFAPAFIHTVKLIENYYEEISDCIATNSFEHSSFVQKNISDLNLILILNKKLNEVIVEHGEETYRKERVAHIRNECSKKNDPGILHRLWPTMVYACTAVGSTFAIYKDKVQFYCGERVRLMNLIMYGASEGYFGSLASVHTDEYFLLPTHAFFEFIKEEDIHQDQPKTLLISEIEPGNRYELVCTTDAGLVRYRMGDVVNCTRLLCRADNLVPLPKEPVEIPRIPLVSLAYRSGTLLSIYGERTNEQHVMNALQQTIHQWREQGIPIKFYDFTSYPNLNVSPVKYVIFLEFITDQECIIDSEQIQLLKNTANEKVEQQLCKANQNYLDSRHKAMLGPLDCILVRIGTFTRFLSEFLRMDRVSPLQVKPHRMLKTEGHFQFFCDNRIEKSLL